MTDKQKSIHAYIVKYHKKTGEVPTCVNTAKQFNCTRQAIMRYYNRFIEQGIIRKNPQTEPYLVGENFVA
jgi:DNA-binding transcriptional regulator YhcF (GntR family)